MSTISLPVATTPSQEKSTKVGNYFVANYPPFGAWKPEDAPLLGDVLSRPPLPGTPLGIYAHIPFCRKRCHFCYFRVYTDKKSSEIRAYLAAMLRELDHYAKSDAFAGRKPLFVYFGGGTPSYLSIEQIRSLTDSMKAIVPWDAAQEVTFEAEPGTLQPGKLLALRDVGVTRLSLGIEHLDDAVLEANGRAHRSREVYGAYDAAKSANFSHINVDLIAGMLEETDERWRETVAKTLALAPDGVTIYQMEVPYNSAIYQRMKEAGTLNSPVADWETKRRWVAEAFQVFEAAGYTVVSATTLVKDPSKTYFYRQGLFNGTDLFSVGVSSFGYVNGVNYQNQHDFQPYLDRIDAGKLPTHRAYSLSDEERYIREFALQLKAGTLHFAPFAAKFGVDPRVQFGEVLSAWTRRGVASIQDGRIQLSREGLMQVDRLIFDLFLPQHRVGRFS